MITRLLRLVDDRAIIGLLLAASNLGIFICFILMWKEGATYVGENIIWVRAIETLMAGSFTLIGAVVFFRWVARVKG